MTTDRPTATRATALPQRAYSAAPGGRQPGAPTDAFSALLGAASPRTDDAPRSDAPRQRRDDVQRPQRNDARDAQRSQRGDDAQPKAKPAAKPADEQPQADAPATEPTTEEPTEGAPRPMTPDIFALQLASPLPPTPLAAAPTGAPAPGTAVTAEGEAPTAAIPAFPALNLLNGITPAQPGAEAPAAEAPTQGANAATPGGVPLPFLAGLATESQTDVKVELPTELPTADAVAPQVDAATAQQTERGRRAAVAGLPAAAAQPAVGADHRSAAGEQVRRRTGPGCPDAAGHPGRPGGAACGRARPHGPAARDSAVPGARERRPADPDRGRPRHHARAGSTSSRSSSAASKCACSRRRTASPPSS